MKSDKLPDRQLDTSAVQPVAPEEESASLQETDGFMDLVLLIRKADLIGRSQWEFRHGKTTLNANIEDEVWLDRFHKGLVRIVPGASMRATVRYRHKYDSRGQVKSSEYDVTVVHAIVPPSAQDQAELFSG